MYETVACSRAKAHKKIDNTRVRYYAILKAASHSSGDTTSGGCLRSSRLQSVGRGGARWPGQHPGRVLQQLQLAVEGATAHHLESHIRVAVVDPVTTGLPGNHREDHDTEAVHQTGLQQGATQGE